uniref:HMA domain-containing protein n=1 Tax=Moniliophthora roreri TaxID=221103 RepID=A0A0W0FJT3_MONRR
MADHVTVFFLSNLHCASCVRVIEEVLSSLVPTPSSIEVSVVLQSVTIHHEASLVPAVIRDTLVDAGFGVVPDESVFGPLQALTLPHHDRHIQRCTLCQQKAAMKSEKTSTDLISKPPLTPIDSVSSFQVLFSVSGMTCSACTNALHRALQEIPGVSEIAVNLLANSATAIIDRQDLADKMRESIEDCGFDATLMEVKPLDRLPDSCKTQVTRTVTLQVKGMFCSDCPSRIMTSLDKLDSRVTVVKPLKDYREPLLTLSYDPDPPKFTVRSIIHAITSDSPQFVVTIFHPPSLEERSRAIRLQEQSNMLTRLIFTVILAIPTFILGIVYMSLVRNDNTVKMYLMQPMWSGNASRVQWALFILATPAMFYSAGLFHHRSTKEICALWRKKSAVPLLKRFTRFGSMNLLVSAGVSVAYFASVALLCLAAIQPPSRHGMGDTSTYFDSVVLLTMFLLAGRYLEAYSKFRTADAITALASLRPAEALLLLPGPSKSGLPSDSTLESPEKDLEKASVESSAAGYTTGPGMRVEKVPVNLLEVGDVVRVLHGATPPADGTIVPGERGTFDESSLTGESRPVVKTSGEKVYLGTFNKGNVVHIRVEEIGGQTMLDNIMQIVREGQTKRAPMEKVADIVTGYFVPVITLLALLTWIIWLSLGLSGSLPEGYMDAEIGGWAVWSLEFAIAVFVVACPCGIGLAAPTALLVGTGLAAKSGILARGGGEAFQEASRLNAIVFDKTGTLTRGELQVSDAWFAGDFAEEIVLGMVHEMESTSSHPLASALNKYCQSRPMKHMEGSSYSETPGRGLKATFIDTPYTVVLGNDAWMRDHNALIPDEICEQADTWKTQARGVVFVAVGTTGGYRLAAVFAVADILRDEAPAVVAWFRKRGITPWIVSGDHPKTALAIAALVGIPESNVIAGVLPHEKGEKVQWIQRGCPVDESQSGQRAVVAMVGDGINDSVALSLADVGVAIGSGSDVAVSSASFILLTSDLHGLVTLVDLSKAVIRRVKFNFVWAIMYNMAALPIAAGVIYPAGRVRLDPVWAALAMALSSISVVCSSLLLRLYKPPKPTL